MQTSTDLTAVISGLSWNGAVAGHASVPAGTVYRAKRLFWELLVVERGQVKWVLDSTEQLVSPPCLMLLPLGGFEERRYVQDQEHRYLGLRLTPSALEALGRETWRILPLPAGTPAIGLARLAVSRAQSGAAAAATAHARSLMAMILDGCAEHQPSPRWSPAVDHALQHLRSVWSNGRIYNLTLAELATGAGVTSSSLCRAFVRDIGVTPMAYQRLLRARIAIHRLRHSQQTIKRIASETGFGDARQLGRTLQQLFGSGSTDFRRNTRIPLGLPIGLDLILWNELLRE